MSENMGDTNPHRTAKADAKAAQAYAKATRPWYKKKRWWAAGLVLIAIIGSAMGGDTDTDTDTTATDNSSSQSNDNGKKAAASSKEKSEPTEEAEEPAVKAMKVQAAAILKEFEGNEAAADLKYKDKMLQVSGEVSKVDTEIFDDSEYVIQINGGGDFEFTNVGCNDQAQNDVVKIKIGQQITVIGQFDDGGDLGVELKDCKVA